MSGALLEHPFETCENGNGPKPDAFNIRPGLTLNQGLVDWRAAMQSTEWRPVVGYEGFYEVSEDGQARRVAHGWATRGPNLRPSFNKGGYRRFALARNGKQRKFFAHRLVARAFLGESDMPLVRHFDGDVTNNHYSNLRWGTHAENAQDAIHHGTYRNHYAERTQCGNGHSFSEFGTIKSDGSRRCILCHRAWNKASKARRKAAREANQ